MNTSSQAFFEEKYRESPDPWGFATDAYELARYDAVVRAVQGRRYRHAFEPGCSVGVLTERLAPYCDRIEAIDLSPTATRRAQLRCAGLPNVSVRCRSLADDVPGFFDLLAFCEIGYYFQAADLREVLSRCVANLGCNGTLVACHWLGTSRDHVLSGDTVHEEIAKMANLSPGHSERHSDFRLDCWRKTCEAGG